MSFDPAIPSASTSPSLFPTGNQTNMSRLKTMISSDHVFNDAAAGSDGYHKIAHWTLQAGTFGDATPTYVPNILQTYTKTVNSTQVLMFRTGIAPNGVEGTITGWPVRAACNFNGESATPITIRTGFNVTNVTKNATGDYTINFTNAVPSADYSVSICAGLSAGSTVICGQVAPAAYGISNTTTSLRIQLRNDSGTLTDAVMVSVEVKGG